MTTYNDLFLRDNTSDTGSIPAQGAPSSSPDIIPYGTVPVNDPTTLFAGNYGSDVGQDLVANAQNYLYMRAKNLAAGAEAGTVSLYYSKASLLLYPSLWQSNILQTSDGTTAVPISAASSGGIAVATNPFTWSPQMISGDHYCLIGRIVTASNPNPIPATGSIQDFATYIVNNRGMGWRNVAIVDSGSPSVTQSVQYNQGATGGLMSVILTCTSVPVGAQVAFSSGTPGPNPVVNLPQTTVTNAASFVVGVTSTIPDNWNSNIVYSYWANGTTPALGWNIALTVVYFVNSGNALYAKAHTFEKLGLNEKEHRAALKDGAQIGPIKGVIVGGHTTKGV